MAIPQAPNHSGFECKLTGSPARAWGILMIRNTMQVGLIIQKELAQLQKESQFMKRIHILRGGLFALLIAALAAVGASAQLSTASLSGTITDSTGAVIPSAKITLTQTDTNFTRVATSKGDGTYHEEFLPIGPYKVSVSEIGRASC